MVQLVVFSSYIAYSVDIHSHEPSSLFHHSFYVDFNVSVMMLKWS